MTFSSHSQYNTSGRSPGRLDPPLDSPGQLALIAVVVWLIGAVIHPLAILAPLGLFLLLAAGVAYLLRPKRHTMYWRGRQIDLNDDTGPAQRLYRMVFKR
jgi:cbb3-type cytochrome oxidase subunit 3